MIIDINSLTYLTNKKLYKEYNKEFKQYNNNNNNLLLNI